ncbi:uncharacterized protein LOC104859397 [Fukomys damarensis]|uniref:uncharacterized protein LOC104859397 n=1 Tax=Fukomys damarensis TaxID=885580 RepID=UPI0014550ED1|nr:uncharacterized protein LOC104859397 [Fukomys damarensis]
MSPAGLGEGRSGQVGSQCARDRENCACANAGAMETGRRRRGCRWSCSAFFIKERKVLRCDAGTAGCSGCSGGRGQKQNHTKERGQRRGVREAGVWAVLAALPGSSQTCRSTGFVRSAHRGPTPGLHRPGARPSERTPPGTASFSVFLETQTDVSWRGRNRIKRELLHSQEVQLRWWPDGCDQGRCVIIPLLRLVATDHRSQGSAALTRSCRRRWLVL